MRFSLSLSSPHNILRFSTLSLPDTSPSPPMASGSNSLIWFRKGILIHDNPGLRACLQGIRLALSGLRDRSALHGTQFERLLPRVDPCGREPDPVLAREPGDLDSSLQRLGSRLLVLNGEPSEVLLRCLKEIAGWPSLTSSPLATVLPSLPPIGNVGSCEISNVSIFQELGYEDIGQDEVTPFRAGKSEALKRLRDAMSNKEWVAKVEKPKGESVTPRLF